MTELASPIATSAVISLSRAVNWESPVPPESPSATVLLRRVHRVRRSSGRYPQHTEGLYVTAKCLDDEFERAPARQTIPLQYPVNRVMTDRITGCMRDFPHTRRA